MGVQILKKDIGMSSDSGNTFMGLQNQRLGPSQCRQQVQAFGTNQVPQPQQRVPSLHQQRAVLDGIQLGGPTIGWNLCWTATLARKYAAANRTMRFYKLDAI